MNDLHLWRILSDAAPDPDELAHLIDQLAGLPRDDLLPYLGRIERFAGHASPAVRRAVARAVGGEAGHAAFELLVALLDDPELEVRLEALAALRSSAAADPPRWAHALFHPDARIRRAAIEGAAPAPGAVPSLWMLADPVCREAVRPMLASAKLGADELPTLFSAWRLGLLGAAEACEHVVALLTRGRIPHLFRWCPDATADAVLAAAPQGAEAVRSLGAAPRGLLGELLELGWSLDDCALSAPLLRDAERASSGRRAGTSTGDPGALRRLAAAVLALGASRDALPRWAVSTAVCVLPALLANRWFDRKARVAAAVAIFRGEATATRLLDADAEQLLSAEIVNRADGTLDLRIAGAIATLTSRQPVWWLHRCIGHSRLVRSFLADPLGSAPLLRRKMDGDAWPKWLVEALCQHAQGKPELAIVLMTAMPEDALPFLEALDADGARQLLEHFANDPQAAFELPAKSVNAAAPVLARALGRTGAWPWLAAWVARDGAKDFALGQRVLGDLSALPEPPDFAAFAAALETARLRRFLEVVDHCARFPRAQDRRIARALEGHADPQVEGWCQGKLGRSKPEAPVRAPRAGLRLGAAERDALATAGDDLLDKAARVALACPMGGIAAALEARATPVHSAVVCAALLGCPDPIADVARELARFGNTTAAFVRRLDELAVKHWVGRDDLPPAGHAWLNRWEPHAFAFAAAAMADEATLVAALKEARGLAYGPLAAALFDAVRNVLGMWRWREPARFAALCGDDLIDLLVAELPGPNEAAAAYVLERIHSAGWGERLGRVRTVVTARLGDLGKEALGLTACFIDARGLVTGARVTRAVATRGGRTVAARVAAARGPGALELLCLEDDAALVTEAALKLIELGEPGCARLASLLARMPPVPMAAVLAESVGLWPAGRALDVARGLARAPGRDAQLRFLIALALVERGEDLVDHALDAASQDSPLAWFREEDRRRLLNAGVPPRRLALGLTASPHPHAYDWSVRWICDNPTGGDAEADALRAFLAQGTTRLRDLRLAAAFWLGQHAGDHRGAPLLVAEVLAGGKIAPAEIPGLLARLEPERLPELARSVMYRMRAGVYIPAPNLLMDLLEHDGLDPDARSAALEVLVEGSPWSRLRWRALERLASAARHARRVRAVAEAFAWGIQRGRELTGRMFRIEMLHQEHELGWTVPGTSTLHVNPLPVLRGLPHAGAIVEGLALHEIGHQLYHAGEEADRVREEARKERLLGLLNLVADEHLERNIGAMATGFRERFRRLGAWAFLHNPREMPLAQLLVALRMRAFDVLVAARPGAARQPGRLRVRGAMLGLIEKAGSSFARFFRALRMGLGRRHGDPLVARALALFSRGFRRATMRELLEVARRLRELFPDEVDLLSAFGQHEATQADPDDLERAARGITQAEVDAEVERVVNPRRARGRTGGAPERLQINVGTAAAVRTIADVRRLPFDAARHAELARRVMRPAHAFRRFLADLGRTAVSDPHRARGRRLDRAGLLPRLLRGDPRILVARRVQVMTDLFMGIVIDCSGSMRNGKNMERARLFGALLAEAGRGVPGVDVRLFGFTDSVIYDAGDASRPAVHALEPGGGNDDAAALWHAARVALASRRSARLVVMVSDGLPTECSVETLRLLVARLTKRHAISCAQVAVRKLEEICFPHHVVVDDEDVDASVRRFGAIVARLVKASVRAR